MRFTLVLLTAFFMLSCGSSEPKTTTGDSIIQPPAAQIEFKKGDFTDLTVTGDPSNAFTVYLPPGFDSTKKYPLVVFFDPHADGGLPLNKYKSLAEKWEFIFVGSNTSKNGMPVDQTMRIGNALIEEVKKLISVEETEIILCGFSGGARVASNIALSRTDVKGLICNSAAPPQPMNGKIYVGLAGLGDMNYLEMKNFTGNQSPNTLAHELLVFDGKHEWAPVQIMEDALLIESMYPVNEHNNPMTGKMYGEFVDLIITQSDSVKNTSCMIAENFLRTGARIQKVVTDNQLVKEKPKISIREISKCAALDKIEWSNAEKEEFVLQQELASAMLSQDTTWWKINSPRYFESKKQGADKFMHQRLRGYASLMCYSYANQAFKANNLHAAEKFVAIYAIVDPTNSEWAYMRAVLYMQLNLSDYALSSLEKAVQLGFKDKNRLQNDPAFLPIRSDARFAALSANMN